MAARPSKHSDLLAFFVFAVILSACETGLITELISTPVPPTPTLTSTPTPSSTHTPTPSQTPTSTISPTPTPTVVPTRIPISPENANDIQKLFQLGSGGLFGFTLLPNSNLLGAVTTTGVDIYDINTNEKQLRIDTYISSNSYDFSPNGDMVAVVGRSSNEDPRSQSIHLFDLVTGHLVQVLDSHSDRIHDVKFDSTGRFIASASSDHSVMVWEAQTGNLLHTLHGHADTVFTVEFSPDGNLLASAGLDNAVILWDIESGEMVHSMRAESGGVKILLFSQDGSVLYSCGSAWFAYNDTLKLWDVNTGNLLKSFKGHIASYYTHLLFDPDHKRIISNSSDSVQILDLETGREVFKIPGGNWSIGGLSIDPTGKLLALGGYTVFVWDLDKQELLYKIEPGGHKVLFSQDGQILITGDSFQGIRLWNANSGSILRTIAPASTEICTLSFNPHYPIVATGAWNRVHLWDIVNGDHIQTLEGQNGNAKLLVFSSDGSRLASGTEYGTIHVWDIRSGRLLHSLEAQHDELVSILFGNDWIASGSKNGNIYIWDIKSGEIMHELENHYKLNNLALSGDGQVLISSGHNATIRLWNPSTGELIQTIYHKDGVNDIAFNPDGKSFISASGRSILIWDLHTTKNIGAINSGAKEVKFSPDGELLAIIDSTDSYIRVWKTYTSDLLHLIETKARDFIFSPDGKIILVLTTASTIQLWEVKTGTMVGEIGVASDSWGNGYPLFGISPDGRVIGLVNTEFRVAELWGIPPFE